MTNQINKNELLEGINNNQKEAILHKDGICLVSAGAGSGKTRVLTNRIANLIINVNVSSSNILSVTFTKKAGEEMKERLYKLIGDDANNVTMGTFHAICFRMLKEQNYLNNNIQIIKDWQQTKYIEDILDKNKLDIQWDIKQCLSFIGWQKNKLITYKDELELDNDLMFLYNRLKILYEEYELLKERNNLIDFDDMLLLCYKMINENISIKKYYINKFKYILVDEFQDTNKAQYEILKLLLDDKQNLFVVGDDFQCLLPDTLISTTNGNIQIKDINKDDELIVANGHGRKTSYKMDEIKVNKYKGKVIKITTNKGKVLTATPNHITFARITPDEDRYYIYLMYKKGMGYRIGRTSSVRARKGEKSNGIEVRLNQEQLRII